MSDQPTQPVAPAPAPPVVDPAVPTQEGSQVDTTDVQANYVEHVLDTPYYGWVFNSVARINLSGQRIFELHDDGTPVQYGTPPDLT